MIAPHPSTQNANGTWNVHGVAIFGPLPAGARRNKQPIGREWMVKAVARALLRNAEGYQGPAHVNHTGDSAPKIPAGQFLPNRVGKYVYEGKEIDAVFADLVNVPQATYERLKRGELPFRSVEVFDWDVPEINELAFLHTETPYFRLGWHGIGREIPAATLESSRVTAPTDPAMAYAQCGAGAVALFAFKHKEDEDTDEKPDAKADGDGDEKPEAKKPDGDEASAEDDDANKDEKPAGEPCKGATHLGAHCDACPDHQETTMPPVSDKDTKKGPEGADNLTALTADVAKFRAENESLVSKLAAAETETGKLIARCAALEQKDAQRDIAVRVETLVAKTRTDLRGYNFSPKVEAWFRKLAAIADKATAEAEVAEFTALCKESMDKDPPSTFAGAVGREGLDADAPEVATFAAQGPDALDAARRLVPKFHAHIARGGSSLKLSEFLAVNVPLELAQSTGAAR